MKTKLLLPLLVAELLAGAALAAGWNSVKPAPLEQLTLDQALDLAERHHPQLAVAHAQVEAAAGRAQEAAALPNPELILGAQQLPLERGALNQREYVAGVAQPIPLGGRLGKAHAAELIEREVREQGLELARRDLHKRVHGAFATALYQEQAFQARSRIAEVCEKSAAITKARVAAGDVVPAELARVEMELARAKGELQRSETMRDQSRVALAATLGDVRLSVKSLSGTLDAAFEIPTLESLAATLPSQPEVLLADASLRASHARVELAKAERIPDVKVEALYHRLEGTGENTFDLGLSIPLPLFNRNQGRQREARAEAAAAEALTRRTRNELTLRLHEAHSELTFALASSRALRADILPRATTVMQTAESRHAAGDVDLGEVLPVRRDWAVAQLAYLESLREVMLAWGALKTLAPFP